MHRAKAHKHHKRDGKRPQLTDEQRAQKKDVYKRQLYISADYFGGYRFPHTGEFQGYYSLPVSYTHLDVYKRQVERGRRQAGASSFGNPVCPKR